MTLNCPTCDTPRDTLEDMKQHRWMAHGHSSDIGTPR